MTITREQRLKIILYLGYTFSDQVKANVELALANAYNSGGDELYDLITQTLTQIDQVQQQINDSRLGAGQSFRSGSGGTSQYFRGDRLSELRQSGRQQVSYLSGLLNLPAIKDVFSDSPGSSGSFGGKISRA